METDAHVIAKTSFFLAQENMQKVFAMIS